MTAISPEGCTISVAWSVRSGSVQARFSVQYKLSDATYWASDSKLDKSKRSLVLKALSINEFYDVRVRAENGAEDQNAGIFTTRYFVYTGVSEYYHSEYKF